MQRITSPPSREEFEARMAELFYPEAVAEIMRGWDWCGYYHNGQFREDKSPYEDHPRAAAWILVEELGVRDPETITLTLIHDICEVKHRRKPTHREVCKAFGYRVAYKLAALTKTPGQDVAEYSRQVFAGGTKAVIAKFGDRLHNLRTLGACDPKKQKRILLDTWIYYYPDSGSYKLLFHNVSPKDRGIIDALWNHMTEAGSELEKRLAKC